MNEKNKIKQWVYRIVFLIALVVFIFSGYQLFEIYRANHEEKQETNTLKTIAKVPDKIDDLAGISVDFKALQALNPDIKAWIVVPGTNISYAVVQGKDNAYYLNHTYKGNENYAGAIFMDYRANDTFQDLNTIIYGHNVKHGTMFAEIAKFKEEAFYKKHRYLYLLSPQGNYRCPIISMYSTDADSNTYQSGHTSWDTFAGYIDMIKNNADVKIDVPVQAGDRIITLSTCSYEDGKDISDKRYVLHALLQPVEKND